MLFLICVLTYLIRPQYINLSFYLNPQLLNNIHSDWPEEEEEEEEEIVIQHFFGSIFCLNHSLFCTRNSL